MTPEEMAHWSYRLSAIDRELKELRETLKGAKWYQGQVRFAVVLKWERAQGHSATTEQVRESVKISTNYDQDIDRLEAIVEANLYLREEAHYQLALGKMRIR
jgi:hypothetical protein